MALMDLTGQKFGRWTVLRRAADKRDTYWFCRCDCGTERSVIASGLRGGLSKSCGCLKREVVAARSTKHGFTPYGVNPPPTYQSWYGMLQRCTNPKHRSYHGYGGRGITVCERWRHDFGTFVADMGEKPRGRSLERRDVNGNYEPGNCYWATARQQAANKRNNRVIEFNGRRQTLIEWARELGVGQSALRERLEKWPKWRALTTKKTG